MPVVGGAEEAFSGSFTLAADGPVEPAVRIPLRDRPGYEINFVWVGDLTGDGEYDFVLDRLPTDEKDTQKLEAYTRTGELLWVVDLGPGSLNRNNIEPGPSAVNVGHWDGLTVYGFDGLAESLNDGKVEKWNSERESLSRLFTVGATGDDGVSGTARWRGAPQFYGDILGDWREEIVSTNGDFSELIICTTNMPTDVRLYTLAHNPAYRLSMTIKGYMQSHYPDYYIGHGMVSPPRPTSAMRQNLIESLNSPEEEFFFNH